MVGSLVLLARESGGGDPSPSSSARSVCSGAARSRDRRPVVPPSYVQLVHSVGGSPRRIRFAEQCDPVSEKNVVQALLSVALGENDRFERILGTLRNYGGRARVGTQMISLSKEWASVADMLRVLADWSHPAAHTTSRTENVLRTLVRRFIAEARLRISALASTSTCPVVALRWRMQPMVRQIRAVYNLFLPYIGVEWTPEKVDGLWTTVLLHPDLWTAATDYGCRGENKQQPTDWLRLVRAEMERVLYTFCERLFLTGVLDSSWRNEFVFGQKNDGSFVMRQHFSHVFTQRVVGTLFDAALMARWIAADKCAASRNDCFLAETAAISQQFLDEKHADVDAAAHVSWNLWWMAQLTMRTIERELLSRLRDVHGLHRIPTDLLAIYSGRALRPVFEHWRTAKSFIGLPSKNMVATALHSAGLDKIRTERFHYKIKVVDVGDGRKAFDFEMLFKPEWIVHVLLFGGREERFSGLMNDCLRTQRTLYNALNALDDLMSDRSVQKRGRRFAHLWKLLSHTLTVCHDVFCEQLRVVFADELRRAFLESDSVETVRLSVRRAQGSLAQLVAPSGVSQSRLLHTVHACCCSAEELAQAHAAGQEPSREELAARLADVGALRQMLASFAAPHADSGTIGRFVHMFEPVVVL